ncbi:adenosylcobinamide-GDP ribazoletransferase, partial [Propionicimonas sp.]|uniref:adenosylcobinamide-GDP ribazoletransferase n=1 Tax=Propionicimonas sp. TaxID=1955623 RepID=UPI0039E27546
ALVVAGSAAGLAWWLPLVAVGLAVLACLWLLARCVRRFGGITGDVLGALVEVAASVLLVVLAASPVHA